LKKENKRRVIFMSLKLKKLHLFFFFLVAIFGIFFFTSCNVFSIFHTTSLGTFQGNLDKAEAAYANYDYEAALDYYGKAVEANPQSSKARVGYVSALQKVRFVDFLYIAQEATKDGFDPYNLLNEPNIRNNIIGNTGVFQETIDKLLPIQQQLCDSEIPYNDALVNLQLAIAYLVRGVISMADTDRDGIVGDEGDFIRFLPGPEIEINTNILNVDEIANSLSSVASNTNTGISGDFNPMALFSLATNPSGLTNLSLGTNSDYRNFIQVIHDSIELALSVLKMAALGFNNFDKAIYSVNLIGQHYNSNKLIKDSVADLNSFYQGFSDIATDIDGLASPFNDFHHDITGEYAYSGNVANFQNSSFAYHIAAGTYGGLMAPMNPTFYSSSNNLSLTNASNIISMLSNATTSLSNANLLELIPSLLTNFGIDFNLGF